MVSLLKTLLIAVVVSAVTAGAALLYVDYKVEQATEAVIAPVEQTLGAAADTVESVASGVEFAVESANRITQRAGDMAEKTVSEAESWWVAVHSETYATQESIETLAHKQLLSVGAVAADWSSQGKTFVRSLITRP